MHRSLFASFLIFHLRLSTCCCCCDRRSETNDTRVARENINTRRKKRKERANNNNSAAAAATARRSMPPSTPTFCFKKKKKENTREKSKKEDEDEEALTKSVSLLEWRKGKEELQLVFPPWKTLCGGGGGGPLLNQCHHQRAIRLHCPFNGPMASRGGEESGANSFSLRPTDGPFNPDNHGSNSSLFSLSSFLSFLLIQTVLRYRRTQSRA